jgi:hypothetical protein
VCARVRACLYVCMCVYYMPICTYLYIYIYTYIYICIYIYMYVCVCVCELVSDIYVYIHANPRPLTHTHIHMHASTRSCNLMENLPSFSVWLWSLSTQQRKFVQCLKSVCDCIAAGSINIVLTNKLLGGWPVQNVAY